MGARNRETKVPGIVPLGEVRKRKLAGKKAARLDELVRRGFSVPKGLSIDLHASKKIARRELAALRSLEENVQALRFPLIARSSSQVEDADAGAAPGLFESVGPVHNLEELVLAIGEVVASANSKIARLYLARSRPSLAVTPAPMAVLVQEFVASKSRGTSYTREPDRPTSEEGWLQWIGRAPKSLPRGHQEDKRSSSPLDLRIWNSCLAVEKALHLEVCGADVEWCIDAEEELWILQARPIVHHPRPELSHELRELLAFSKSDPHTTWELDGTHNPFPMSPAQIGLVELVADLSPSQMRVVGGYLYTEVSRNEEPESKPRATTLPGEDARTRYLSDLSPRMNQALRRAEAQQIPGKEQLETALAVFREVFAIYLREVSPLLASLGQDEDGVSPITRWLLLAAEEELSWEALLEKVGAVAPAWDVCVPTFAESPQSVRRALDRVKSMSAESKAQLREQETTLREDDDILFYRAQALVRRALLSIAEHWDIGDEIFYMTLSEVRLHADKSCPPPSVLANAERRRKERARQEERDMPRRFSAGVPLPETLANGETWIGVGVGGYAEGVVLRPSRDLAPEQIFAAEGKILVLPNVTPAHALCARGAIGIVCQYGDSLGHGAAMARELGIPCIVGCRGAWAQLRSGEHIALHGDSGRVVRTGPARRPDPSYEENE